jgi:hypothetical protein
MIGETPEWAFWAILGLLALMMLLPTIKRCDRRAVALPQSRAKPQTALARGISARSD